ncbi:copper chaperone [Paraburkholderia atlantica]|uniref:Copper chaperone n=1 Tax=Paraburkholderia atlantica TaxID=2654982 RepID=A0A6I1PY90_PARAM|nr:heavy-metal-associated domain-containing protein [Paraburkholderia atlantica]MBB5415249.1 copper chaperone [Paraburkholderia atlantica]MBB5424053.1 copper chaperone [Paraburkholderia atlantica]MPW08233.1 heavy metal transporter [Paraburkholderia atlantica]NUY30994.1 heavy-metal-associated domain-containing protein [Paraburkholderia atlantica]
MEFKVADMSCGGCASAISKAIAGLDPAAKVQIDVAAKTVKVESSSLDQRQIAYAIEQANFHPVVIAP